MDPSIYETLCARGVLGGQELRRILGVSQPTLSRRVQAELPRLWVLGKNKGARYAARRRIEGLGESLPLLRIDEHGKARAYGELLFSQPRGVVVVTPSTQEVFDGNPFFLNDLRPQGFLGNQIASKLEQEGFSTRLDQWSENDYWRYWANWGEDLPGNWLLGQRSLDRWRSLVAEGERPVDPEVEYPRRAELALLQGGGGSSVGGDHPKFIVQRSIVKYSPKGSHPAAVRWSDLLIAEGLALSLLASRGVPVAEARVLQFTGRTFLESRRFDRVGIHGRLPLVSFESVSLEWLGELTHWSDAAQKLHALRRLSSLEAERIALIDAFGAWIANTDRHFGNLSFFWAPDWKELRLAPVYDMLPMAFAPVAGEVIDPLWKPPAPHAAFLEVSEKTRPWGREYWGQVAADLRISDEFRRIAERYAASLGS